jgi:hypothetical protein
MPVCVLCVHSRYSIMGASRITPQMKGMHSRLKRSHAYSRGVRRRSAYQLPVPAIKKKKGIPQGARKA